MVNDNRFSYLMEQFKNSHYGNNIFYVPSQFITQLRNLGYNVANQYRTFYICPSTDESAIFLIFNNSTWANVNGVRAIYLHKDYTYSYDLMSLTSSQKIELQEYKDECLMIFNNDFSLKENSSIKSIIRYNHNYLEDFQNSQQPSQYIFTMLYVFIPILLFIFALKVFKNGLFR